MASKHKKTQNDFETGLLGFTKVHFGLIALLTAQTILYDASMLITPDVVLDRWFVIAVLLLVNGFIYYFVKSRSGGLLFYKTLLFAMIIADFALASYSVYTQRGFAANAVFLFVIPIIISGLMLSRAALYGTSILAIAIYSLTAVAYFVQNFNEGYKVELYGEVGFYSTLFLLVAWLMSTVLHPKR